MDERERMIATEISALSSHYPARKLSQGDRARWLDDFVSDLAGYDERDVRLACAMWRKSEAKKMPTPGELLAICYKVIPARAVAVLPPPKREEAVYSEEHKAEMRRRLTDLAEELAANMRMRDHRRRPRETEVEYGRRLWPNREVVR